MKFRIIQNHRHSNYFTPQIAQFRFFWINLTTIDPLTRMFYTRKAEAMAAIEDYKKRVETKSPNPEATIVWESEEE